MNLFPYQEDGVAFGLSRAGVLIADQPGLGKDQPLTARILTPNGWMTMGDMRVGQEVIGRDGRAHQVTGVFPQGIKPIYRVYFRDGTFTECGADHLWAVRDVNRRRRGQGWVAKPLSELLRLGINRSCPGNRVGNKWEIPLVDPVEFDEAPHRIDPYVLGVLIGDGYLAGREVVFSNPDMDEDIREEVRRRLPEDYVARQIWRKDEKQCPQFTISHRPNGESSRNKNAIKMEVRRLGLNIKSPYRFIPAEYKIGSVEQRLALLRGLMDTDGSSSGNRINYSTLSSQLADNVADLVRSLGGVAIVKLYDRTHEGKGPEFRVNVKMNICPFICSRKAKNWKPPTGGARVCKFITDVKFIGFGLTQCISVSAPDHLYVTDDYIVTHNTCQAISVIDRSGARNALIICPASLRINWEREVRMWLTRPLSIGVVKGGKRGWPKADIIIINYDLLKRFDAEVKSRTWDVLVCDEAHILRNGIQTSRGQAVLGSRNAGIKPIAAKRKVFLTGTPIMNRPAEIWPLIHYLDPQRWSSYPFFARRYCGADEKSLSARGATNLEELQAELRSSVMLRREKKDVLKDLPPKTRQVLTLPSTGAENEIAAELAAYADLKNRMAELRAKFEFAQASPAPGDHKTAIAMLKANVNKARAVMARARKAVAIAKLPSLIDQLESQLENGEKIVVFVHHRVVHETIMHHFGKIAVGVLGRSGLAARQAAVDRFQTDDTVRLFVGSIMAAGVGLTLTASSHVVMGELDWTPSNIVQCEDRCHRIGAKDNVLAQWIVLDGSLDSRMAQEMMRKAEICEQALDGMPSEPIDADLVEAVEMEMAA